MWRLISRHLLATFHKEQGSRREGWGNGCITSFPGSGEGLSSLDQRQQSRVDAVLMLRMWCLSTKCGAVLCLHTTRVGWGLSLPPRCPHPLCGDS